MNLIENKHSPHSSNFSNHKIQNEDLIKCFREQNYKESALLSSNVILKDEYNVLAYSIKGLSLSALGEKDEAIKILLVGISKNPNNSDLCNNLANIYLEKHDFNKSKEYAKKAVSLNPFCSSSYFTLGVSLNACKETNEAIMAFKKSFKLNPKNSHALLEIGNLYKDKKDFAKSLDIYRKYQKHFPSHIEGFYNESCIHLRNQRFKIGWGNYDTALKDKSRSVSSGYYEEDDKILWDGKPFDGSLLIYGEQGLGDQIIFGTVIPDLLKVQKNVILKVNNKLVKFFKYNFKNISVYSENEKIPKYSYEKYIAIGSLCKYFRNSISDFTYSTFKGFSVPKKPLELKKLFANNNPIIGVSWYTTNFKTSVNRSLSCEEISKIISQSGYNFVNLQYGKIENQIEKIQQLTNNGILNNLDIDLTNDINALSNLILNCDLVLTIDNTTAHLSSSIGQKTWVLLPYSADFRWFENSQKSLWYKTATLFRQHSNKNWDPTIKEILNQLNQKTFVKEN